MRGLHAFARPELNFSQFSQEQSVDQKSLAPVEADVTIRETTRSSFEADALQHS